jgi:hypothetical protein
MSSTPKIGRRGGMTIAETERVREAYRTGGAEAALAEIEAMFPSREVLAAVGAEFRRRVHEVEPVACPAHDRFVARVRVASLVILLLLAAAGLASLASLLL